MKTTPTTTVPASKATTDRSVNAKSKKRKREPNTNLKPPVAYPDLEDHIPEDYLTTQDLPQYGKGRSVEEE